MNGSRPKPAGTTLRFALIGAIGLAMLIPLAMVGGISSERQRYFNATLDEVAAAWGGAQAFTGPYLVIPETHSTERQTGQGGTLTERVSRERIVLPEALDLAVEVSHQMRKRAIYQVPVYTAVVRVSGRFPAFVPLGEVSARLDQARLLVGISHTRAISNATELVFGGDAYGFQSGTGQAWVGTGIQAALAGYDGREEVPFSFELTLKGTRQFGFAAVGRSTHVQITSTWPHPSFTGQYLPERYEIDADGFDAQWNIHELARSLPGQFLAGQAQPVDMAWVGLFQPVTEYTSVDRAIKYGLLFVALTFLAFVCFELMLALRFHAVHYGVVGIGLALFYLVLLALSEYMDFGTAYLLAAALLTGLIGAYVRGITASWRTAAGMAAIVLALYGTLYVLLVLETFALLLGTGVLLLGLAALMVATRRLAGDA